MSLTSFRSFRQPSCWLICTLMMLIASANQLRAAERVVALEIDKDTKLDPEKTYGPIIIKASNITIDGQGAVLVGATTGASKTFKGNGIFAAGVSNVILKNVKVRGFETGLKIVDGEGWYVEGCDFSNNFHDPDFGWGEQGRRGGIVLERVRKSTFKKNKANNVWDACALIDSNDNAITGNDFSKTSNTCLKLWTSCRNRIEKNNLSYGIRISPGEVHARDSTSVLIESGSNDNVLTGNDCTHGGDGIFVRVLNGWVSTGNHFQSNDCSYANNNGVECWAPRNVFIKNKANYCSYGFWMGGSDQTRLIDNEASFNGDLQHHHNSPHLPNSGHAGIVFMFGPGSHTVARGNTCKGNNGAGIAVIGDIDSKGKKWKAFHWVIEQNTLVENRWGIYLQYADWIEVAANDLRGNSQADIKDDGGVTRLTVTRPKNDELEKLRHEQSPQVVVHGPGSANVGETISWDASDSRSPADRPLTFAWDLGDGTLAMSPKIEHAFKAPGFYRLGVTIKDGILSDVAWRDFYVVEKLPEFATEGQAADWGLVAEPHLNISYDNDKHSRIAGSSSVHAVVDPYHGTRASLMYPQSKIANISLQGQPHLVFWLKTINPNLGWQDVNPVITLYESDSKSLRLSPKKDMLSNPAYNESRDGWRYFEIPLAGDDQWLREGGPIATLNYFTIGVDSWDAGPLQLWIDGLAIKAK